MSDRYAAITARWHQFQTPLMCRALDYSLSGYYEAKTRLAQGPSVRARADELLLMHVRATFAMSHGRYGAPRVLRALRAADVHVGKRYAHRRPEGTRAAGVPV